MDETEADQVLIDDVEEAINGVKFECTYCQELVGDLAKHCLEKHGIEDETKGEVNEDETKGKSNEEDELSKQA
jgi:hypothetical protein